MINYKENRGSEWRKWDLHVHTPESGLNNGFGSDWDLYVKTLFTTAIKNEVAVIGITDYFLIDGYKKLKNEYLNDNSKLLGLFGNQDTVDKVKQIRLLPNIEFRLGTLVNGSRINYHIILSDELTIEEIEDDFLGKLDIKIDQMPDGIPFKTSLNHKGLEKLGAILKKQDCRFSGSEYTIGCEQACVSDDDIISLLNSNAIFKDKFLIAIPVDEDLSKVKWLSQGHNERKKYYQQAHAFFTSNEKTRNFAFGKCCENEEEYLLEFKSFKPCFIGSDAHSNLDIEEKLGQWDVNRSDQSRITWIKADATFEGLRQTLYEPETRVRIQPTRPEPKAPMHVISAVSFKSTDGTFDPNQRILLNENLNTIIGGKSSGKSLLLYAMANAINRILVEDYYKTLRLDGYNFIPDFVLEWKDGKKDSFTTKEPSHTITYIPQLYINHLAEKRNGKELNEFILELLQQNVDFRTKYELFVREIQQLDNTIQEQLGKMFSSLDERRMIFQEITQTGKPEAITKSIETLKLQIKEITEKSTLSEQEKKQHEEILLGLEKLAKTISQYQACIEFLAKLESLLQEKIESLVGYDTKEEHYPGDVDNLFAYYNTGIPQDIEMLVNTIREDLSDKLRYFLESIHQLTYKQKLEVAISQQKQKNEQLEPINKKIEGQKDIIKLQEQLNNLNEKLAKATGLVQRYDTAKKQFGEFRKNIVALLAERSKKYKGLVDSINTTYSEIDTDIHLSASLFIEREAFSLYDIINKQRTTSAYFTSIFPQDNQKVNYEYVPNFFADITSLKDGVLTFKDNSACYVNKDVTFRTLFSAITENRFKLMFDVKYKSDSLHQMSPGKKGTVLLILFLQISTADYPILIDQPEDNLDNRTIYTQLCTMIKRKKSQRQIIIVTHNANLVVGTDSENVIVANQEGQSGTGAKQQYRFEYVNGPIELSFKDESDKNELTCQGIREHICDVLEGGLDAFENRERKYGFKR